MPKRGAVDGLHEDASDTAEADVAAGTWICPIRPPKPHRQPRF